MLFRSILTGNSIGPKLEIALASLDILTMRIVEMGIEDLLCVCERSIEPLSDDLKLLVHRLIIDVVAFFHRCHLDLFSKRIILDASKTAPGEKPGLRMNFLASMAFIAMI